MEQFPRVGPTLQGMQCNVIDIFYYLELIIYNQIVNNNSKINNSKLKLNK